MKLKTRQLLKRAGAVIMSAALLAATFPGFVSGLTTVKGEDAAITKVSHSWSFTSNADKATPVLGEIVDGTVDEATGTLGILYAEESTGSLTFDANLLKFRSGVALYLPIQSDTTKITYKQTCSGNATGRPTYVGQNKDTYKVEMSKTEVSVTIDDITDLIKTVNGQKYVAVYSTGDVKVTKITLEEYNPINRVTVSGTLTNASGITAISFKNMSTEEVTTAEVAADGTYSTVLKRVAGSTTYVASVSNSGCKVDDTDEANVFTLTGNSASAVENFTIVQADVAKVSGTVTGVPDSALKGELSVKLVPTDNTLATVVLELTKTADGSYTYAEATVVPEQDYKVELVNANDYEVLATINKAAGSHTDVDIQAQAKPVYNVTGTFKTSDGKNVTISKITFTNMNEAGYSYTFDVSKDSYTAALRAGEYETSVVVAETGYTAFDHVSVKNSASSGDVTNIVYIEGPEDTSAVAYEEEMEVGKGKRFETIQAAVDYIKRMERTTDQRVTIKLTDNLYREQIVVDTPNVSIVGTEGSKPTITWYYGIGYSYYSVAPGTEKNKGFYSEKYAVDKYTKTAVDTHWGTAVELSSNASGFRSENVIYESSFNRYMTTEEVEDGVGPGGDATKVDRSKATDTDVKKNANKERACTMYIRATDCEYKNCEFLSSQDTLFTGDGDEKIYFKDCLIEGTTDFICGNGNPVFDGCTLSIYGYGDKAADGSYITASKEGGSKGYLFYNCKVVRTSYPGINTSTKNVYFGRPWGAGTKMLVYNTEVETADLIHTAGYADMSTVTPADAFYSEYNTHTPDGTKLDTSKRATGVKILTDAEAEAVTVTDYFGNWDPYYYDSGDVSLADYSEVDEAIEKAEKLNADNYVDFSGVSAAIEAVVRDIPEAQQSEVDAMAKAINDAIAALELKPADYSKVDEAVAAAGKLNADDYKDFAAVTAAVNAVVRDYTIDKQSEVDAMAKAINDAIAALEPKSAADYSKVDEAIAAAGKLTTANYKDFSGVTAAVEAVVRNYTSERQSEVDAMAKAINDAIAALELKPADYSKVDEAVAAAGKLNADDYKDFAAVTAAVNAVVRDYTIDKQSEVDAMAKAINDAITALDKKTEDKPDDKPEEPDKPDTGNIEVNTDSKIPVTVDGTKAEIAEKIPMTEEEKKQYDGGANIAISIKIEDNSTAVSKEDKETVEKLLKEETLGQYIDISVFKTIGSNPQTKVAETKGMIKISIKLPENLKNTDATKKREYYIVRVHNGVAEKLNTVYNEDGTLTFESDKFSTYAIVYSDTAISNPDINPAPPTGDNTFTFVLALMTLLLASGSVLVFGSKKNFIR